MTISEVEKNIVVMLRTIIKTTLSQCASQDRFKWAFMEYYTNDRVREILIEVVENDFPQHLELLNKLKLFL